MNHYYFQPLYHTNSVLFRYTLYRKFQDYNIYFFKQRNKYNVKSLSTYQIPLISYSLFEILPLALLGNIVYWLLFQDIYMIKQMIEYSFIIYYKRILSFWNSTYDQQLSTLIEQITLEKEQIISEIREDNLLIQQYRDHLKNVDQLKEIKILSDKKVLEIREIIKRDNLIINSDEDFTDYCQDICKELQGLLQQEQELLYKINLFEHQHKEDELSNKLYAYIDYYLL